MAAILREIEKSARHAKASLRQAVDRCQAASGTVCDDSDAGSVQKGAP